MCRLVAGQSSFKIQNLVPLFLSTLFLIDVTYIISCNLRENKILNLFSGLLTLDSWYLLSSSKTMNGMNIFFLLLNPIIITCSIKFCFLFIFQGYKYRFKKTTDFLLLVFCIGTLISVLFSNQVYASMFGIQFIGSLICVLFIIFYHWKRICFVLKNEWKIVMFSIGLTLVIFFIYYLMTLNLDDHIGNFGMYIVVFLFSISVHGITFKESKSIPLTSIFSLRQLITFISVSIVILYMTISALDYSFIIFVIMINILFAIVFLCNIILEQNLKNRYSTITINSKYMITLNQLLNEERLKTEFATFLHDEVLQDLLSVKNMTSRSNRPEVQKIIYETLDNLNVHIRNQMHDYHPIILKSLTLKENLANLIEGVSETFPNREIKVSFECSDNLFIAKPYDILIYRLTKELLTNIFKHSDGKHAWIILSVERNVLRLSVCDNGSQSISIENAEKPNKIKHKGLSSIKEQIEDLGGHIIFSKNIPQGARIEIEIIMNGDDSYKHFIG
ncbi:ATP-binding protein [Clostridium sp. CCUG 7971]|nr:ATP-binding protein [Clostridium sp. CCUG 7971]